jgi:hypothetical protein
MFSHRNNQQLVVFKVERHLIIFVPPQKFSFDDFVA